jgi:hypothetical protein
LATDEVGVTSADESCAETRSARATLINLMVRGDRND